MVYDPELKSVTDTSAHPHAGQPEQPTPGVDKGAKASGAEDRNARRRAQRAAAKIAREHQASTGRDLDVSGRGPGEVADA